MAVVPYYNRKGYNELSKKAEAALGNIHLETGVLITWYKGQHLGRINRCSRPDFTLEDLKEMLTKLHAELIEEYGDQNSGSISPEMD